MTVTEMLSLAVLPLGVLLIIAIVTYEDRKLMRKVDARVEAEKRSAS